MSLNHARMPGPGDLPGDSRNPNSPDYVDPLYGEEQAEDDVAKALIENDRVGEVIGALRALLPALRRIKEGREIPQLFRAAVLVAHDEAVVLQRMVDERLARGESAARDDYRADLDREFERLFAGMLGVDLRS